MFAVAALAACTTEQTIVAPQNEAIGFDTFVDNSTRAEDITTNNIANFGVYGTVTKGGNSALIFNNTEVAGTKESGYTYSPAQYWIAAAQYDFLAFAPYAERQWTYTPTDAQVAKTGTFSFDNYAAAADQDVVYAYKTKTTADKLDASNTQAVEFTFKHILSKVAFSFTNTFTDGNTTLSVYNVKINNTAKNGTMAIVDGEDKAWVGVDNLVVPFGDQATAVNTLKAKAIANKNGTLKLAHHYVIPAERAYNITFDVDLYQAGVYLATYNHTINSTIDFAKNGNYVLSVKLAPESIDPENKLYPIEFTVNKVDDWGAESSVALAEPTAVASETELKAAIADGKSVKLAADITLDEPLQITKNAIVDLNGHNISSVNDVFEVAGGALTINGDGVVNAATTNGTPYCAVWAYGDAVVNIYGGTYKIGYPTGDYNDLVYAKENAVINIYGGTFHNSGRENAFVLNVNDQNRSTAAINVYGGSYEKFNPADNESEGPDTNFVAPGKTVEQDGDWYIVK